MDDRDLSALAGAVDDADGYLLDADGEDPNQRYVTGFDAPDPFFAVWTPEGVHLLVSELEYGRAKTESRAVSVARLSDYDYRDRLEEVGRRAAQASVAVDWLADHGVAAVRTPDRFPLGTADRLRDRGVSVETDPGDAVESARAVKTETEIDNVRAAQRANEAAFAAAGALIRAADTVDGVLHDGGDPLTSERVKVEIERTLLEHGCGLDETIVACGADAADPHDRGSGPLRAGEPIVVDIFPRSKATGYHADTTRTWVRGEPTETLAEWHRLTDEARAAALDAVEPGATGADVHAAACEVYEDAGLPTLRTDPAAETGFIHSTGHGVGLAVHELPRVAPDGDELEPGNVITVEPGLYDPAVGGVRVEDIVVVREDGYENLTTLPTGLEP
ncbi:MAG: Xaa-Pro peptidase family protein [Haloferacaceae archaeon]